MLRGSFVSANEYLKHGGAYGPEVRENSTVHPVIFVLPGENVFWNLFNKHQNIWWYCRAL